MSFDWKKVKAKHVQQACKLFDAGSAVPARSAKTTYLLLNGKRYPAKFIRGQAYRIATGKAPPDMPRVATLLKW